MIIAIDGPSGAGKSTVAKSVAARLGFNCLDTGAMYRCIAWYALEHGISLDDANALTKVAQELDIEFGHVAGDPAPKQVFFDGVDVTSAIREARIDKSVSRASAHAGVREALVDQQRRIGNKGDYVVEGRDIGTVVFPQAQVKVFLTASNEERAKRRVAQNAERGVGSVDFDEVLADIVRRDQLDSNREASPLTMAEDACHIDSSSKTIEEIIDAVCALAQRA